jgi:YVTN family beta-propeller protein
MIPNDIEMRLRSYLDDLTNMTPLARPSFPREGSATEPTLAISGWMVAENAATSTPGAADYQPSWKAPCRPMQKRRSRLMLGIAATLVIVAGLALAFVFGPRSSDVGGPRPDKTTALPPAISGLAAADAVVPIDTTTNRPGVPIPLGGHPDSFWIAPNGLMLYVAGFFDSQWAVVPIDTVAHRALPAIPVGEEPNAFALTPNGSVLFVLDEGGGSNGAEGGDITPINTSTDQPGPAILADTAPTSMVMTPNGETLYVADDGSVYPVDVTTDQVGPPIKITDAYTVAVTPDGRSVYVLSGNGTVSPIDTATNVAGRSISVGIAGPLNPGIVITPSGKTAYVLGCGSEFGPNQNSRCVIPINTATNIPGPAISVSAHSDDMILTPDGRTLYLAPSNTAGNDVTAIDTKTNAVEKLVKVVAGPIPGEMVATPNSRTLYVAGENPNTVTPITVATNAAQPAIAVGADPYELAISPNGKTLYSLDVRQTPPPG